MRTKEHIERLLNDAGMCIDAMPDHTIYVRLQNDSTSIILMDIEDAHEYQGMTIVVPCADSKLYQTIMQCSDELQYACEHGRWYGDNI